jgi:hypothetical protein
MTRAAERPKISEPEVEAEEELWEDTHGGETPDSSTAQTLNLAHRAAEKFPELANRYKSFAGPAVVVSGALVALAGVAVARRSRRGQTPEEILDQITSEEIERASTASSRHNRIWRMLLRIGRRRRSEEEANAR